MRLSILARRNRRATLTFTKTVRILHPGYLRSLL